MTLEVETHFNCYDNACYFGSLQTHWDTNMPQGYLDTLIGDPASQPHPTVGSSDTRGMQAGVQYYTMIRFNNGNSNTDTGAIAFQVGHRDPSWCSNTLCIFGDATQFVVPKWVMSIPTPARNGWGWSWSP